MSFYNTGNPVPSIDPRDLDDNAKHIDEIVNSTFPTFVDRTGVLRLTLAGMAVNYANIRAFNGKFSVLDGALASLPENYDVGTNGTVIAIGRGALGSATQVKKAGAIGPNSQGESTCSRDNWSYGEDTLRFVHSRTPDYDQAQLQGTRNWAAVSNALRFLYEGYNNLATGRNAGQGLVNQIKAAIYGSNAVGGYCPIGLSGIIENWSPMSGTDGFTAVGAETQQRVITDLNTSIGTGSLNNLVKGRGNNVSGNLAMRDAEIARGYNGNVQTTLTVNGNYSHSGNVLSMNIPAHGVSVGFTVGIRLTSGDSQTFAGDICPAIVVSVIDANNYTVAHPISRTASGTASQYWFTSLVNGSEAAFNSVHGYRALLVMPWGNGNSVNGTDAMINANDAVNGIHNNVADGFRAGSGWTSPQRMTFLGMDAGRFMQDGSMSTGAGSNSTCLGYNSRVSGNDQVQLGGAGTTPYAQAALQIRSDARDKIGFRPLSKPIEFIRGIEWCEFRKNERSRYVETIEKEDGTFETIIHENDGSLAGARFHAGAKAQQVQALCEALGIDWAGLQHHAVNGGLDIFTVAYEALIPYMGECIQHLLNKNDEFEARLSALEAK